MKACIYNMYALVYICYSYHRVASTNLLLKSTIERIIKSSVSITNSYYREVRNYKYANFEKLNNLISQYCWDSVINDSTSVDQASLNLTNSYIDLCKTCIPRKRVLIRPSDKPWFSSELRYNIRLRDRLRQKALKTNLVNDKLIFKKTKKSSK